MNKMTSVSKEVVENEKESTAPVVVENEKKSTSEVGEAEVLTYAFCDEEYVESENKEDSSEWFSETHKGRFIVDEDSDLWYKWHEGRGNPNGKFCRENYCNSGGYVWSICGCQQFNNGECMRSGKHKPDYDLSDDDYESDYSGDDDR